MCFVFIVIYESIFAKNKCPTDVSTARKTDSSQQERIDNRKQQSRTARAFTTMLLTETIPT